MSRLEERLVARWSPYQLNVGAMLLFGLFAALAVAGLTLLSTFPLGLIAGPLCLLIVAAAYWLMLIGLCPLCGKSPMTMQIGRGKLAEFLRPRRAWPEQSCSACGCDLTVVQE